MSIFSKKLRQWMPISKRKERCILATMWKDNQILLLSKNLIYIKWDGRKMKKAFGAPGGGCAEDVMCGKEKAWVREDKEQRKWSLGSQGVFWLLHFAQGASVRLGTITAPIPKVEQIRTNYTAPNLCSSRNGGWEEESWIKWEQQGQISKLKQEDVFP